LINVRRLAEIVMVFMLFLSTFTLKTKAAYYLKDSKSNPIYLAGYGPYKHIFTVEWGYAPYHTKLWEHHINFYRLWPLHGFYKREEVISGEFQLIYNINEEGKCDLTSFDQSWWDDLRDLLTDANKKGIYVQISLFDDCSLESHSQFRWTQHPFNKRNNVNGVFNFGLSADNDQEFYNLNNPVLLQYQQLYVGKLINETWSYENVIYEIINEGDAKSDWIIHWVNFIDKEFDKYTADREPIISHNAFPHYNPIYSGFDNPNIDMINWHGPGINEWDIGTRPEFIENLFKAYYGIKPQCYDEGPNLPEGEITDEIRAYARREIWSCFVNGGYVDIKDAHLDRRLDPANYMDEVLLDYFKYFGEFRENLNFGNMTPHDELITSSPSNKIRWDMLANPGNEYVVYITGDSVGNGVKINVILKEGNYKVRWFDPKTGKFFPDEDKISEGKEKSIQLPKFTEDIVLYITRMNNN